MAMKPASERRYIGKSFGRVDIPAKVTGAATYAAEVDVAGVAQQAAASSRQIQASSEDLAALYPPDHP